MSAQRAEQDERFRERNQRRLARMLAGGQIELVEPEASIQTVPVPLVLTPWGYLYIP